MRFSMAAIAAAMTFAFSLGAHADIPADGSRTLTPGRSAVHFGDLNIATEQGAEVLLRRIERAARKACGGHPTFSSYSGGLDNTFEECRNNAMQRAVRQLNAPMVSRQFDHSPLRFDRSPPFGGRAY